VPLLFGRVAGFLFTAILFAAISVQSWPAGPALADPTLSAHGMVRLNGTAPAAVTSGQAALVSPRARGAPMSLSVELKMRNQAELNRFIATKAIAGRYMSQARFDHTFGTSKATDAAFRVWAHQHGFHVTYASPDGLTFGLQGSTGVVQRAMHVQIDRFRLGRRLVYGPASDPTMPARLNVDTIVGLDDFQQFHSMATPLVSSNGRHADDFTCPPYCIRSGGYYPPDFRTAYDVAGHGVTGAGQTIGLTLWGPQAYSSDFALQRSGQTSATGVTDPLLRSCVSKCGPDTVTWIPVGSKSLDPPGADVTEASMDAEFSHGMAPGSRLHFYLAPTAKDAGLVLALRAAASDPAVHVVSNSWGGGPNTSNGDPFVKATAAVFQKAIAVGTTFYFSSGDNSQNSGCPLDANKQHTQCVTASYPASSPYVVSVGGTNMQMDQNLAAWTWESAWNSDPNNGYAGGGTGCVAGFPRPKWQARIASAATCAGRAEPDISADADPQTGALVYTNDGQSGTVGGTSLAAPLVAGMAVLTNAYLAKQGQQRLGWAAPEIYKLGNSAGALYNSYFHDVRCGFNGAPGRVGWDQATGFGSLDWYNFARGVAGATVTPVTRTFGYCTQVTKVRQISDPWDGFLAWPVLSKNEKQAKETKAWDNGAANPMHGFHTALYSKLGVQASVLQTDTFDLGGDGSFSKTGKLYYLASMTKNNTQAVALMSNVLRKFTAQKIAGNSCLDDHGNAFAGPDFPGAPVDCYYFAYLTLTGGVKAAYAVLAEQNAVIEILATAKAADAPSGSPEEQNLGNSMAIVLSSGITQVNQATNSWFGEQF
jgi:pseudomonalisin